MKRTPGISPFALPLRPKPARRTSSFSSTKFRQPSLGTVQISAPGPPSRLVSSSALFLFRGPGDRTESSDLLAVLDELHTHALANSLRRRRLATWSLEVRGREMFIAEIDVRSWAAWLRRRPSQGQCPWRGTNHRTGCLHVSRTALDSNHPPAVTHELLNAVPSARFL